MKAKETPIISEAQQIVRDAYKAGQAVGYHEGFDDGVKDGFKAGYESAAKATAIGMEHFVNLGRKEVVAWIYQAFNKAITIDQMMATTTWQYKAHEWGLSEEETD